ncbi:receptor-like protein kinase At5g59670, partial [Pistacia vera]|uniref:receptor-like protein kinase At5g59670 n=1 Tax=Pistacia vera TaxID=55513 RepID=UPI001262F94A
MDKWLIFLLLFTAILPQTVYSKYYQGVLLDCGSVSREDYYDGWPWMNDEGSISTGETKTLQINNNNLPGFMDTLRYFPDGVKNCYTLYPDPQYKFLFRAGFYYGNYDGLSKPPTFDILLDNHFWAKVDTSSIDDQPIYHEIFYKPKADRNSTSVCLVHTRQGEVPFISSLEVAYLLIDDIDTMYSLMGNDTALNLVSRDAFGGLNKVLDNGESNYNSSLSICYDITFRVWQPKSVPGYLNVSYSGGDETQSCLNQPLENRPPDDLLKNAISPENATDSIYLNVDFKNSTQQSAYFVFYFLDYNLSTNPYYTRKFEIHIDGALRNVVELNISQFGQVVSLFPVQVSGTANVTISPVSGSKFPPILNGMEVYTATKMDGTGSSHGFKLRCSGLSLLVFFVISF